MKRIFISYSHKDETWKNRLTAQLKVLQLQEAWEDKHTHVVTLVAWGGVGKTALVNHWLNIMEQQGYCGAQRVYCWSFYSQGAEKGKYVSADEFMQNTLTWFGDPEPWAGDVVQKAKRLVNLIRKERTLMILDGLEPFQYPPGELQGYKGRIKDHGLRTFLKELAGNQPGLCVITTRESLTDLTDRMDFSVKEILLEHLSLEAGAQLLGKLGAIGPSKEIMQAVQEYGGHALALNLLGYYLHDVYQGDVRKRDKIPSFTLENKKSEHARRVLEAYEQWLGDSPELNILYIMGLFDRAVKRGTIEALMGNLPVPGITEQLMDLSEEDWQLAVTNLKDANLLSKIDPRKRDVIDCHPLIREHFAEKLREENPGGWKEAHSRLYHYYKNLPEKESPDTLQEMEPLFASVAHGCAAGLHQLALDDVYFKRIMRGKGYAVHKLGAFGADLAVLSHFFDIPWSQPATGLKDEAKAFVLNGAGFDLRGVGRLQEAIQPIKTCLDLQAGHQDWKNAASSASSLSELMLTLGRVRDAVDYARQAVSHADKSEDSFTREYSFTSLGDALHKLDHLEEAEKWFREAEALQMKREPEYRYLISIQGFRFCDLLLGQGNFSEVEDRAENTIKIAKKYGRLLDIALDRLSLGRAWMMQTLIGITGDFTKAEEYLNQAVAGLRKANNQEFLLRGLLARAECSRWQKKFKVARQDLQEAQEIADMGSMSLYLADYHLEAGKLCATEDKKTEIIFACPYFFHDASLTRR